MEWSSNNSGGHPTAAGGALLATVTFWGLPEENDAFGAKTARLFLDGQVYDQGAYEVFYPKDGLNHPHDQDNAAWPNWMYYWLQTVTPLGSPTPTFTFGTWPQFTPGTNLIQLAPIAAGSYTAPYGLHNPLQGIDSFAYVVMHESQHYEDWCDFWSNDYQDWFNYHRMMYGAGDDRDCDVIPNDFEDLNWNQTYDTGDLYDWQLYNTPTPGRPDEILNDFEDWDCMRHRGVTGDHAVDWGNPGMQHATLDVYSD
jgi:hypothetical protein